jgi:hypothetical protein
MPPEIVALIDKPHLLLAVLFVGAFFGMTVEQFVSNQRRAAWKRRYAGRRRAAGRKATIFPLQATAERISAKPPDAAEQLRIVMSAAFRARRLLNRREARLFDKLDKYISQAAPGWRVMAQVSLGEILASEDEAAYRCINSKRVDLLLIDDDCHPLHAIEYQGGAHHQGTAAARDAVKKEALRRAGIGYVEVVPGDTPAELRRVIEKLVRSRQTDPLAPG